MTDYAADDYGQSKELHEFGMKHKIPPMAQFTVLVDFDDTIIEWGPLMSRDKQPKPGAIEALRELIDRGYIIVVFTSRMSRKWAKSVIVEETKSSEVPESAIDEFLAGQYNYVYSFLEKYGLHAAAITAEKVPAIAYIDDKAIGFRGDWNEVLNDDLLK